MNVCKINPKEMLDLKKLEEKLDIALSNESEESLTKWLLKKRNKTYSDLANLGDGKIETRGLINQEITFNISDIETKVSNPDQLIFTLNESRPQNLAA